MINLSECINLDLRTSIYATIYLIISGSYVVHMVDNNLKDFLKLLLTQALCSYIIGVAPE